MRSAALLMILASSAAYALVECDCDPGKPETMAPRQCGLCREAEKHPAGEIFFLKDINPRKPNRMLALPKMHGAAHHAFPGLPSDVRTRLWTAALEKARSLWGDQWALAMNGDEVRTQCHTHLHIGKFIEGVETENFIVVDGPEQIPAPTDGTGLWVHPVNGKLHVHLDEQITETVLMR